MSKISEKIREIRLGKRFSLRDLAKLTHLSVSYLSKIERASEAPRLVTLQIIANALEVELSTILEDHEHTPTPTHNIDIVTKQQREEKEITASKAGYAYQSLVHSSHGKYMSPFFIRLTRGKTSFFHHDSEEFVYILSGKVKLVYEGKTYLLEEGDSHYIDSRIEHNYINASEKEAVLLAVIFDYKRF